MYDIKLMVNLLNCCYVVLNLKMRLYNCICKLKTNVVLTVSVTVSEPSQIFFSHISQAVNMYQNHCETCEKTELLLCCVEFKNEMILLYICNLKTNVLSLTECHCVIA